MRSMEVIRVPCLLVILVTVAAGSVIEDSAQAGLLENPGSNQLRKDGTEFIANEASKDEQRIPIGSTHTENNRNDGDGGLNEKLSAKSESSSDLAAPETLDGAKEKKPESFEGGSEPKREKDSATKSENVDRENVKAENEGASASEHDAENANKNKQSSMELLEVEEPDTLIPKLEMESNSTSSDTQKVSYNGVKVLRVVIQNREQKKMIKRMEKKGEISTWLGNGTAVDILIRQDNVLKILDDKNLSYDIIIDDLQKAIEEENPPISQEEMSELEGRKEEPYSSWTDNSFLRPFHYRTYNNGSQIVGWSGFGENDFITLRKKMKRQKSKKKKNSKRKYRRGHKMTWQMYHRMDDIHGYIDYLTATYPDLCSQETIGHSVEGRPLKVLKISSAKSKRSQNKAIWVDSGIHAREWITPATSTYIISQMVENGDGTHGVDWYFLPIVNPDGYEHSHTVDRLWRKNRANANKGQCAGTDLNRNFGYRWGGQGASQQPCRETYAGPGPFSEPETSAINKYVLHHPSNFQGYVSLHSYGQYILYPWGYDRKVPPDYSDLHRVGRSMAQAMRQSGGQFYRVGSAAATLYPASGGSDDWAKGVAKIKYVYTIELRDTGRHGFVLPAQYIHPTAKEAYAALKVLAKEVSVL